MDRRPQGVLPITLSAIGSSSAGFFTHLIHSTRGRCCFGAWCPAGLVAVIIVHFW
jgi:hypothetical protein